MTRRHVYLQFKRRVRDGKLDFRVINTSTDDDTDGDRRHTLG